VYQNRYPKYLDVCLDSQITAKILEINIAFIFFLVSHIWLNAKTASLQKFIFEML